MRRELLSRTEGVDAIGTHRGGRILWDSIELDGGVPDYARGADEMERELAEHRADPDEALLGMRSSRLWSRRK